MRSPGSSLRKLAARWWEEAALAPLLAAALRYPPEGLSSLRWNHWLWVACVVFTAAAAFYRHRRLGPSDKGAVVVQLLSFILLLNLAVRVTGGAGSPLWLGYFLCLSVAALRFSRWWQQALLFAVVALLETVQPLVLAAHRESAAAVPGLTEDADLLGPAAGLFILACSQVLFHVLFIREREELEKIASDHHRLREEADSYMKLDAHRLAPELEPHSPRGRMARGAGAVEDRDRHLDRLLGLARRALDAQTVVFFEREGNGFVFRRASEGEFTVNREMSMRLGEGVIGGAAKMGQSLLMADVGKGRRRVQYLKEGGRVVSLIVVPVQEGNVLRGVMTADHSEPDKFTKTEQEIFEGFATEVNLLIENIRASSVRDRRSSNMEILSSIGKQLSKSLNVDEMFEGLLNNVGKVIPYAQCAVFLLDPDQQRVVMKAQRGFKFDKGKDVSYSLNKGLVGWIIRHRHPLIFSDRKKMEIIPGYSGREKMRSVMGLPFYFGDDLKGAIFFASPVKGTFTTHQLETVDLLMGQVGAQVSNALLHRKMKRMALTDGLTGLYNHRHFQERLSNELERSARHDHPLGLLLLDIDYFKKLNDSYGHPFGDVVLKGVSAQLSQVVRNIDLVARYGGEEFAIVLVNTRRRGINLMADRILKVIRALSFDFEGTDVKVAVSIGSAMFPKDGETKEEIVRRADQALYCSKESGRDRHTSHVNVRSKGESEAGG